MRVGELLSSKASALPLLAEFSTTAPLPLRKHPRNQPEAPTYPTRAISRRDSSLSLVSFSGMTLGKLTSQSPTCEVGIMVLTFQGGCEDYTGDRKHKAGVFFSC